MRVSRSYFFTLRDAPAGVQTMSGQLLQRAGFLLESPQLPPAFMPLGRRTMERLTAIIEAELDRLSAERIALHAAPGRAALATMTHRAVRSYRHLPRTLAASPGSNAGEGLRLSGPEAWLYALVGAEDDPTRWQQSVLDAWQRVLARADISAIPVNRSLPGEASVIALVLPCPHGELRLLACPGPGCGYTATLDTARCSKTTWQEETWQPLEEVATPEANSIAALADFLQIPRARTAKAVLLSAQSAAGKPAMVFAVVRGDMEASQAKIAAVCDVRDLRPATLDEIASTGAVAGYASPIGIRREGVIVVVDEAVRQSPNLVAGANRHGFHLRDTVCGRDYSPDLVGDISATSPGDPCPRCQQPLQPMDGLELGGAGLGWGSVEPRDAPPTYLDAEGKAHPVSLAWSYLSLASVLRAVVERHHDGDGILWPASLAPFAVYLLALGGKDKTPTTEVADNLYQRLTESGIDTLYDDRDERPGVKFKDADLIGLPARLTVSPQALENGSVELRMRGSTEKLLISLDDAPGIVRSILGGTDVAA